MAKYRKKPVTVEAYQFRMPEERPKASGPDRHQPGVYWTDFGSIIMHPSVTTIHGQRTWIEDGDWIILEPDGQHYYPCKADIFEATYEPA
jgi:hypothetical protein